MFFPLGDAKPGCELGKLDLPHPHFHLTMPGPHLQWNWKHFPLEWQRVSAGFWAQP